MEDRKTGTHVAVEVLELMDPESRIDSCMEWGRFRFRGLVFCLALAGFGKSRVIAARRTFDEQCQLYGLGRSADEMAVIGVSAQYARPSDRRVTWLDPRYSRHVQGLAIDVDFREYRSEELDAVVNVARQLAMTWGGAWSVRDYAHFEI